MRPMKCSMLLLAMLTLSPPLPLMAQLPQFLTVDGRSGANPSLASRGAFVALAFSAANAGGMDLYVATSRDAGRSFGAPVHVNAVSGQARVSGEQPPRVALVPTRSGGRTGDPEIVIVWTVKAGSDWQLLQARSADAGRTFGAATPVPGSEAAGSRGWEALSVDDRGRVSVLWLDHRDEAAAKAHAHGAMASKPDPTEQAKLSRLYFGRLDGSMAKSVTQSVCYCCKTALVQAGGATYAAWRQVYPGSIRDIAFSASRDGGRTFSAPVKVSDDQWQINGCPDNGPTMAVDAAQQVHVLWPTAAGATNAQQLALYYARSLMPRASNGAFTKRVAVPTNGQASHPTMVIGGDGVPFAVWDEIVEGQRRLGAARVQDGRFTAVPIPGSGGRYYPTTAAVPGGAVVAWVQQSERTTTIGVARVALP
jgi:hypothetical protein